MNELLIIFGEDYMKNPDRGIVSERGCVCGGGRISSDLFV